MKRETDYGIPINEVYTPEDIDGIDYLQDLGHPGQYPYTRGYYPRGYRDRIWTQRMTVGFGSSAETNQRLKEYHRMGERGGMCVILDRPGNMPIDSDHPMARGEVGVVGWPANSLADFEELMDGIPMLGQSITLLGPTAASLLYLAYMIAYCEKLGIDPGKIHGGAIMYPFCTFFGQTEAQPFDLNLKLFLDAAEYVTTNKVRIRMGIASQHFRESGANNAQALGVEMAMLDELCGLMVNERGLDFDDFADLIFQLVSVSMRFFEEIAKMRAMRRMWAKLAREKFKAKKEKSCHILMAVHTSGRTMTYQQPLNNIARTAIETLAGAIGGCTAIDNATFDNAQAEPSPLAGRMSLSTQHIIADETGVADVVDPLGGSYFIEYLTNKVEEEAYKFWNKIEEMGGMIAAAKSGFIEEMLNEENIKRHNEIENGERVVIGVNKLVIPPEEDTEIPLHEVKHENSESIAKKLKEWKKTRNKDILKEALWNLYKDARKGDRYNLMPATIEAVKVYATGGEIIGVIREARGLSYDPFGMIESPFEFK